MIVVTADLSFFDPHLSWRAAKSVRSKHVPFAIHDTTADLAAFAAVHAATPRAGWKHNVLELGATVAVG